MNYIAGSTIKAMREKQGLTQKELADRICVSDKTISKWETNKGFPDISILEDLARALGISVTELLTGDLKINENQSGNVKKMQFYVCPVCGNVITALGQGCISCCGITLPSQEAEAPDEAHPLNIEIIDHEYYVTLDHPMTKNHYISFMALVTSDTVQLVKLYPEQEAAVRFRKRGHGILYAFCNRHGMFRKIV